MKNPLELAKKLPEMISKGFGDFKGKIHLDYGENPGKLLVHTGVLGWILSSLAQVKAVVFNDKITPEEKLFLIPQEIADAGVNILSFYLITNSMKNFAGKMVKRGKWTTPAIQKFIKDSGIKNEIGKIETDIGSRISEDLKPNYKLFKNGMEVLAGIVGSTISSNIVTPILRNKYAAHKQKDIMAKNKLSEENNVKPPKGISIHQYQRMASLKFSGSPSMKI